MTDHQITPPPELLQQWAVDYWGDPGESIGEGEKYIAIQSARWGADTELEACCRYIGKWFANPELRVAELRAARRPKPPSLAEQALDAIDEEQADITLVNYKVIRAALERLQELEGAHRQLLAIAAELEGAGAE